MLWVHSQFLPPIRAIKIWELAFFQGKYSSSETFRRDAENHLLLEHVLRLEKWSRLRNFPKMYIPLHQANWSLLSRPRDIPRAVEVRQVEKDQMEEERSRSTPERIACGRD